MSKTFLWESALEANDEDTRGGGMENRSGKIEIYVKNQKRKKGQRKIRWKWIKAVNKRGNNDIRIKIEMGFNASEKLI